MEQLPIPNKDNEAYWELVEKITFLLDRYRSADKLMHVNLSAVQELLSEAVVEDDNAPVRSLISAINRAVNADGGGTWTDVDLSGVREFVLPFVSKLPFGHGLMCASAALQNDRDVVMTAVNQAGRALEYASDALQDDREVVMAACNQYGEALKYASAALRADREVVMAAVNQNGMALQFASDAMKDDREVALAACNQTGIALKHTSGELKADCDLVMVAAARNFRWKIAHGLTASYAAGALKTKFEGNLIVTHVRSQLELRSSFFGPFLCAIALPRPEAEAAPGDARCLLPKLDIGEEKPIQHLIADFTGVAYGSSWRFVQLAAAHLESSEWLSES